MTLGCAAPLCFTTMRDVAHITLSGDLPRMPQHASVISGTSTVASISGKIISATGSSASSAMPSSAKRRAKPRRSTASGSPDKYRLATLIEKPLSASQTSPSMVGAQLRLPRSSSWTARP
jgi:hypothetical protein